MSNLLMKAYIAAMCTSSDLRIVFYEAMCETTHTASRDHTVILIVCTKFTHAL